MAQKNARGYAQVLIWTQPSSETSTIVILRFLVRQEPSLEGGGGTVMFKKKC